jgi:TetR/AcrR family transcriptional regulator
MSRRKLETGSLKPPCKPKARAQALARAKTEPRQVVERSRVKAVGASSTNGDSINRIRRSTKDRILAVATKEFSARGYDGARIDAIMRQSKISKNLIYHYFVSKEHLFIAVLESAYEKIRKVQAEWATSFSSPTEGVRMLVRMIFNHWRRSPEFMRLLSSENFHKGRHLRKAKGIKTGYASLIANLDRIVKEGERSGEFRPNIDPVELFISISSLSYHYFSNRYTLLYLLDHDGNLEEHTRSFLAHTEEVVLRYVQFDANRGCDSRLSARHLPVFVNRR